jgi:hypothetical protein
MKYAWRLRNDLSLLTAFTCRARWTTAPRRSRTPTETFPLRRISAISMRNGERLATISPTTARQASCGACRSAAITAACDPTTSGQSIPAYLNAACVVVPTDPSQRFGIAPRNSVRAPWFWQVDLALSKQLAIASGAKLEVRIEAFNLLNRTNVQAPNGNRSSGAFGTITSAYDARQLQLGAKLLW